MDPQKARRNYLKPMVAELAEGRRNDPLLPEMRLKPAFFKARRIALSLA
ncbi:MAG: hypothetical protein WBF22_10525 [Methylocella sp.]